MTDKKLTSEHTLGVRLYTAKQAAEYLNVSENMVRKMAYHKEIPYIKMGASLRFMQADLDAYIMRSRIESA